MIALIQSKKSIPRLLLAHKLFLLRLVGVIVKLIPPNRTYWLWKVK